MKISPNLAILTSLFSIFSSSCGSNKTEDIENSDSYILKQMYAEKCTAVSEKGDWEVRSQSECDKLRDIIDNLDTAQSASACGGAGWE